MATRKQTDIIPFTVDMIVERLNTIASDFQTAEQTERRKVTSMGVGGNRNKKKEHEASAEAYLDACNTIYSLVNQIEKSHGADHLAVKTRKATALEETNDPETSTAQDTDDVDLDVDELKEFKKFQALKKAGLL